eukprot:Hpha_TRINITY_DN13411_c0_g1::TRINITY_DN13411_c0_g1_i1::g.130782::m.130782/K12343/SRD5A1; 3-oxo-5-alpha-steroid 4-dehydrogenase 1
MGSGWVEWLSSLGDEDFHRKVCYGLIAVFPFVALSGRKLVYGRYWKDMNDKLVVPGRLDWYGHFVSCAVLFPLWQIGRDVCKAGLVNKILLACYGLHYINRSVVFGIRMKDPKPVPLHTILSTFSFCAINGYCQGRTLTAFQTYPEEWLTSPCFLVGMAVFLLGAWINVTSDTILFNLRKPGEKGYKIPRGGWFEWVSGANFFGEIVEWWGFALASWSLSGLTFAFTTTCAIGPRALQHHKWYLDKFEDYPKSRKALIPFIL